jgi:ATP-grasp domain-containing protein
LEVSQPRILLVTTLPWVISARLATALRTVGCHVEAVCQFGHPLRYLRDPIKIHRLGWLQELSSVEEAIRRAEPDFILPCDDPAVEILHCLHGRERDGHLAALIERSLGNPAGFATARSRSALITLARSMGLCVPPSEIIASRSALEQAAGRICYPNVLKCNRTWGGAGVAVAQRKSDLRRAWSWVAGGTSFLRAGKAMLRDRRPRSLLDRITGGTPVVELQEFIVGIPANRAVLCRDGHILAGISVLALETAYSGGPATVVRIVDHPQMTASTAALVKQLGLTGLCGFDFVVAPAGQAYLLELNPRATPICHFALPDGTHLPAALYQQLTGRHPASIQAPLPGDLIVLFATRPRREPPEPLSDHAHHDVPWDEPELLARVGFVPSYAMPTTRSGIRSSERLARVSAVSRYRADTPVLDQRRRSKRMLCVLQTR